VDDWYTIWSIKTKGPIKQTETQHPIKLTGTQSEAVAKSPINQSDT
jgi:hypothetical protein